MLSSSAGVTRVFAVLVLAVSLVSLAACGTETDTKARTENLPAFSVTLPEGWATNLPEGMECMKNRCIAGFTEVASGSRSAVTVSVVPNLGKNLEEIAAESAAGMARLEADMQPVARSANRIEYRGTIKENEARLVATIDEAAQEVGVLLFVGENDTVRQIVGSIRMANPNLDFFRPEPR